MEDRIDFNHDDLLDRAVEAVLRNPAPDELPSDRVADLVAQVQCAADKPTPITLYERITNMKPITRIAVAATILIAFAGLISWLAPHGGMAVAFADVAEALNSVENATWKTETAIEGTDKKTVKWTATEMYLAPCYQRTEITAERGKSISITDGQKNKVLVLEQSSKTATVLDFKNVPSQSPIGRTFQSLKELVVNAQSGKDGIVDRIGEKTIDGRRAEGFHMRHGAIDVKLWADPKTSLPVRIEESATNPSVNIVMTDFQTGMKLDKSLFSVDVPAGYTVQQTAQLDFSKKPIQYVADALKMTAEYNDGVFPPTLRGEQGIDGIIQRGVAAVAKNKPTEATKLAMDVAAKLGGTFGLIFSLRPENDWHYAGKDVKLGTPDKPIFWYKPSKNSNYQVLYADLSIKEVAAKDAPDAPAEGGKR